MAGERGPQVPDYEDAYRAIIYDTWWVDGENRPSSAAFSFPVFSVDIASRTTPAATAGRFQNVIRLAQFNCGAARQFAFDTRDEADETYPENDAHAHVYSDGSNSSRKKMSRRLADICVPVEVE